MSDYEMFYIPKHLDTGGRWLFWTIDEAGALFFPMVLGFSLGYFVLGIVFGILTFLGWKKIKGTGQTNLALFALYWFFPSFFSNLKVTPASYHRFYVG